MKKSELFEILGASRASPAELARRRPALAENVMKLRARLVHEASQRTRATIQAKSPAGDLDLRVTAAIDQLIVDQSVLDEKAPLALDPVLQPVIEQARVAAVLSFARISEERTLPDLEESTLEQAIRAGAMTDIEAQTIGTARAIFHLAEEDFEITGALMQSLVFAKKAPADTRELAALTKEELEAALEPKLGKRAGHVAGVLAGRFAALHPVDALIGRRLGPSEKRVADAVSVLAAFSSDLDVRAPLDETLLAGLSGQERERLVRAHRGLARLARAYPGLDLAAVFSSKELSPGKMAELAVERIALLDRVRRARKDVPLLELDYSIGSSDLEALDLRAIIPDDGDQRRAVRALAAVQRTFALTKNAEHARSMIEAGYHSAIAVARAEPEVFRREAGLSLESANAYIARAQDFVATTVLTAGGIFTLIRDALDGDWSGADREALLDELRRLDGFAELFGSQAFCACEACQSIFGHAAYFVDLMYFVDHHVRRNFFSGARAGHPLDLHTRRPDLLVLELSCRNTTERIPTLEIVNEVLENYIARPPINSLANRPPIEALVYENRLAGAEDSYRQPFVLGLESLHGYLAELGAHREDVARVVQLGGAQRVRCTLGLSEDEYNLIVVPRETIAQQRRLTGIETLVVVAGTVDRFDVVLLEKALGDDHATVGRAIATWFVRGAGAAPEIRAEKATPESVQNDVENVYGLTVSSLDRLHRFTRLRKKLELSVLELDYLLRAGNLAVLDAPQLADVARLVRLMRRLGADVEQVIALFAALPAFSAGEDRPPLFERVFNAASFVSSAGVLPVARRLVHPVFRQTTADPGDPMLLRLSAALGLDVERLGTLARALSGLLGFNPAHLDEEQRGFMLNVDNLSVLYRHAQLAQRTALSTDELLQLLALSDVPNARIQAIADLEAALDAHESFRRSGRTLDDLAIALGVLPRDPTRAIDPASVAAEVRAGAGENLMFEATIFAVALGLSETESRAIVEDPANAAMFETVGDRFRLAEGDDGASLPVVPAGIAVAAADLRTALAAHHPRHVALARLSVELGIESGRLSALAAMTNLPLSGAPFARALRGDGVIDPLAELVRRVIRLDAAFPRDGFDGDTLAFVRAHPAAFGLADFTVLTWSGLRAISAYARALPFRASLEQAIAAYSAAGFPAATDGALGTILGVGAGLAATLRARIPAGAHALDTLSRLASAAELIMKLGVDGDSLARIVSDVHADQRAGARALRLAIIASTADEKQRDERLRRVEEPLRVKKREALADYIVYAIHPELEDRRELYPHFLLDLDVGGCSTTSRVVAAISSVQLYIHRILLGLEQNRRDPVDPQHVQVELPAVGKSEWAWRKNYRVWEANRKIFLYPENYLEPDLRDDKTPLFRELEGQLLQQDVNDQTVLDAYSRYVAGFDELAQLAIAGAFHDLRRENGEIIADILHLFGVTSSEPPVHYYRTVEGLVSRAGDDDRAAVWSPWEKVEAQISARRVSPVIHRGRLNVFWTEARSRPESRLLADNSTEFIGYQHTMTLKATALRLDGTWAPPQAIKLPSSGSFAGSPGRIRDRLHPNDVPRLDVRPHDEPDDDYVIRGPQWEWLWLEPRGDGSLGIAGRNYRLEGVVDLFGRTVTSVNIGTERGWHYRFTSEGAQLYSGRVRQRLGFAAAYTVPNAFANTVLDLARWESFVRELDGTYFQEGLADPAFAPSLRILLEHADRELDATIPIGCELLAVPGSPVDLFLQTGVDLLYFQGAHRSDGHREIRRAGTTLAGRIARTLFEEGVDGLLDLEHQRSLHEADLPISIQGGRLDDRTVRDRIDFDGAYGVYYWELFFHIPELIANHLNASGRYAAADRWYRYIFDPTATEPIPAATAPADRPRLMRERVWRFLGFRDLTVESLRNTLTSSRGLEAYRSDPFNPHAIARLRPTARQKSIVMKYVDNLLDWADDLFTQFTTESVNEATLLYATAQDILGARPPRIGDCGEGGVRPRDYLHIAPLLAAASAVDPDSGQILIELETLVRGSRSRINRSPARSGSRRTIREEELNRALELAPGGAIDGFIGGAIGAGLEGDTVPARPAGALSAERAEPATFRGNTWRKTKSAARGAERGESAKDDWPLDHALKPDRMPDVGWSLFQQLTPVFCVPPNKDLLAYWDRVEDRLWKIRNCRDINGEKRELALAAPEIDPRLLVRARAAGLSLEDILSSISGSLPPYRFSFLIERAKAHAAGLQGLGQALLAALEKKDNEELGRLRVLHQQNLTRLSTQLRTLEIDAAAEAEKALLRQRDAATKRHEYYEQLLLKDLSGTERRQQGARDTASTLAQTESLFQLAASIVALIPQLGSPFALKYGGVELEGNAAAAAAALRALQTRSEHVAANTAVTANFERRREGWVHARDQAALEEKSFERQIIAAQIRQQIAQRALTVHEESAKQLDETFEAIRDKFSNLGRYTWLAGELKKLFRASYNNALALARLAEEAFRFERDDENARGLAESYWDASNAGLLAGERLLIDLQSLERRYLESNYRTLEVDQAFSMQQLAPAALLQLRETGECEIEIPEIAFDLYYPGQYRRRIRAVRMTIPCVTGPFTNVSASLTLLSSQIRRDPSPAAGTSIPVSPRRSVSIATSTAQNDGGVFELSFRDERYMPFEGAGAVSRWSIALPRVFRPFDYQTIADVILSMSYSASYDGALRDEVERQPVPGEPPLPEANIRRRLSAAPIGRVISLRQEMSAVFARLLHSPAGTVVRFELDERYLPAYLRGGALAVDRTRILLRLARGTTINGFSLRIDGDDVNAFAAAADLGGLRAAAMPAVFSQGLIGPHTIEVVSPGDLAPPARPGDVSALNGERLLDVLVFVELRMG